AIEQPAIPGPCRRNFAHDRGCGPSLGPGISADDLCRTGQCPGLAAPKPGSTQVTSRSLLVLTLCLFFLAIAMALYVWQLRSRAQVEATLERPQVVTPPATGAPRQVTLWVAHDGPGVLRVQAVSIELSGERQRKTQEILRALLAIYTGKDSPHHLAPGADVRNVYFVNTGLVVVDINAALADGQTSGILPEQLTVASFVQTLSS